MINILFKKLVKRQLRLITQGCVYWNDGSAECFGDRHSQYTVTVTVHNKNFYRRFVLGGSIGAAESFCDRDWECTDLTQLCQIVLENPKLNEALESPLSSLLQSFMNIKNYFFKNTVKRSKKNILKHYDLGNEFFSTFLDDTHMYSSAVFNHSEMDLKQAQLIKLGKICEKLRLSQSDHVLEIGTGWGGFAIFAAKNYGCKVTTTTISDAQFSYATHKIKQLGLDTLITVIKEDYRKLQGQFDKLVSIEMIEAVGHQFFPTYFKQCAHLLKVGGRFCLQAITINDGAYSRYIKETDFIKKYIFPGGCLPSMNVIKQCSTNATLQLKECEFIGMHYAKTLQLWHERLLSQKDEVIKLGFNQSFLKLWEFYFCYCRAGFLTGYIDDVQALMIKQ